MEPSGEPSNEEPPTPSEEAAETTPDSDDTTIDG